MYELILISISFFATIIAIKGKTWESNKKGLKKISLTGYLIFILAFFTMIFNILKSHNDKSESIKKRELLERVSEKTATMQTTIYGLYTNLDSSRMLINQLQAKIDIYI